MRRRSAVVLVVAVALALVGGAACSSGSDDDGSARSADAGGASEGGEVQESSGGGGGDEVAAGATADIDAQAPPADAPERIIYTSEVRVRVDDPAAAAEDAVAAVEAAGGSLAGQDEREGEDVVTVTVRVPVEEFRPTLDALSALGVVLDKHVAAEEVTDQVVDLEGRLENARASADRLRELYATAEGVDQIVSIEQALTQREAEVEALAGELQQLEDRADRSTITATFVDEGEPVEAKDEEEVDRSGFVGGLRTGWDVIVAVAGVLATLAGFLVPFLPLLLVPAIVWLIVRRRTRRAIPPPDPGAPAGTDGV